MHVHDWIHKLHKKLHRKLQRTVDTTLGPFSLLLPSLWQFYQTITWQHDSIDIVVSFWIEPFLLSNLALLCYVAISGSHMETTARCYLLIIVARVFCLHLSNAHALSMHVLKKLMKAKFMHGWSRADLCHWYSNRRAATDSTNFHCTHLWHTYQQ